MPPVSYIVRARDDAGHVFEQTYKVEAPASLLASSKGLEATNFLKMLCATYTQSTLQAAPFRCVVCGDKATSMVNQPFVFLQTAEPTIFNQPAPVCGKGLCDTEAKQNLQAMVHQMGTALGTDITSAEVHLCAKCGQGGADKMCSRCMVTAYCCRACRKDDWSKHKKACHPARPLAQRLSQFA